MHLDITDKATYTSECLLLKISMKYNFWGNFLHFAAAALANFRQWAAKCRWAFSWINWSLVRQNGEYPWLFLTLEKYGGHICPFLHKRPKNEIEIKKAKTYTLSLKLYQIAWYICHKSDFDHQKYIFITIT